MKLIPQKPKPLAVTLNFNTIIIFTFIISNNILSYKTKAQKVNFNEHIAPIIHQNCSPCHRDGEAGPFQLITYNEVKSRAKFINKVAETRYMPPWKAEVGFGEFKNERHLTDTQIAAIKTWVTTGMKEGPKKKKTTPVFNEGTLLNMKPDLSVKVNIPYQIPQKKY